MDYDFLPYLDDPYVDKSDADLDAELEAAEAFWLFGDFTYGLPEDVYDY